MPAFIDLTECRFEHLYVLRIGGRNKHGNIYWRCLCDCGRLLNVDGNHLRSGVLKSCGCYKKGFEYKERQRLGAQKHGESKPRTAEYRVWKGMHDRCECPSDKSFGNYGGRGIKVCLRWRNYENFLADMGRKPTKSHTIERIDVNGNYEPRNCKWATAAEQGRNTRGTKLTMEKARQIRALWKQQALSQAQIGRQFGVCRESISHIIYNQTWKE
jgi:hypothetical protein